MKLSFNKLNNIFGWLVFLVAATTYIATLEPNFSFWDCGEYISSAIKLEVTHSPGAVFFQILGAVWSIFAMGDGTKYSFAINAMSGIMSAFTILFLFWTITHLARIVIYKNIDPKDYTFYQKTTILLSGLTGSLTFIFTDTFWFSAVEGEVYAAASCFTALLLWLICKWENDFDSPRSNRWLVLISLIIGLSVGVHLMAILVIPTLGYIYYTKKYTFTWKNFIIASAVIGGIFLFIFKIIFPLTMTFFGKSEIFFVNNLQMPFNSGTVFAFLVIIALFYFSLNYTIKHGHVTINTILLSVLFMLIGFSSWVVLPIRANANPPINLNDPDNAIGMLDYYNRDQYGDWPVFYGANYTAYLDPEGIIGNIDKGPIYQKDEKAGRYVETGRRIGYEYNPEHVSVLPRMYNYEPGMMENYAMMEGYPDFSLNPELIDSEEAIKAYRDLQTKKELGLISIQDYQMAAYQGLIKIKKPTFSQNFHFMMNYQINYMFLRYFLWNFSGRQNDIQGHKTITEGNWISGIKFIDNWSLGDQTNLPPVYTNKATNKYYFLPLLLGLLGFFFQLNRDPGRNFALIALFLLTSVGIILYTSMKAFEPRERDYALVSSFYTFAIWIGLGTTALIYLFNKIKQEKIGLVIGVLTLGIPVLVAFQNWDDHDRSERYAAYDFSKSYVQDLDKNNPILFVYGDNDTYPLWALQETEEFRSDVKIVNYTLLGTSWYIDQVLRKTYKAPALPSSLSIEEYRNGANDQIHILDKNIWKEILTQVGGENVSSELSQLFAKYSTADSVSVKETLNFLKSKDIQSELRSLLGRSASEGFIPSNKIYIPVDKSNALKYGIVKKEDENLMVDYLLLNIDPGKLYKEGLAMLNLFANYKWDRSIYFSGGGTYANSNLMYTQDYLEYQGLVSKLVPIYTPQKETEESDRINSNNLYQIVRNYKFGNYKDPKAYFDETCRSNIISYRQAAGKLAVVLAKKGDKEKAKEILTLINKEIPLNMYPLTHPFNNDIITTYILIGEDKEALKLAKDYKEQIIKEQDYYLSLPLDKQKTMIDRLRRLSRQYSSIVHDMVVNYVTIGQKEKALDYMETSFKPLDKKLEQYKMQGEGSAQKYPIESQNLKQSYLLLFHTLAPLDSIYFQEKLEEINKVID